MDPLADQRWMARALELAQLGRGRVEPNPLVGCVIVRDDAIIGEGYHKHHGGPHAEREALAACSGSPAGATAYITLEPCCHTGKKTPPCVPFLLEAKLARVVAACEDPNPSVSGEGLRQLRQAGIDVQVGVMADEARQVNAPFFALTAHGRPYITLKWAQTADGKVAGPGGERLQISNEASMKLVHRLRAASDAVMVGIETVLRDDPLLTPRGVDEARTVTRIVLDSRLRLPADSKLVQTARQWPVLVFHVEADPARAAELTAAGVELVRLGADSLGRVNLREMAAELGRRRMTHLLVDAGPTLAAAFMQAELVDRVWIFHSSRRLDSPTAPAAPAVDYPIAGELSHNGDTLREHLNPTSPVFFTLRPSADLTAQIRENRPDMKKPAVPAMPSPGTPGEGGAGVFFHGRRRPSNGTLVVIALVLFALLVAGGRAFLQHMSRSFTPPATRPAAPIDPAAPQ